MGGLDGEWGEKDQILTLALTVYRDGLCKCGRPLSIAHHPDNNGWYSAHETTCHACRAVEKAQKDNEREPGTSLFPVYDRPSDLPIGAIRRHGNAKPEGPADD